MYARLSLVPEESSTAKRVEKSDSWLTRYCEPSFSSKLLTHAEISIFVCRSMRCENDCCCIFGLISIAIGYNVGAAAAATVAAVMVVVVDDVVIVVVIDDVVIVIVIDGTHVNV